MRNHWIIVASADHVGRGVAGEFVHTCHGKAAPLRRMKAGDQVFCYSPVKAFGGKDLLQAFTAIGTVRDRAPYVVEMANGFRPHRRDVAWTRTGVASIRPLLDKLELTAGRQNWGMPFRTGLVRITARDAALISLALSLAAARACPARTPKSQAALPFSGPAMMKAA